MTAADVDLGTEIVQLRGGPAANQVVRVAVGQDYFERLMPVPDGNGGIHRVPRIYRRSTVRTDDGRAVFVHTPC